MANMHYCMFENTLADLRDARDKLNDSLPEELSEDEARAREWLISLCVEIANDFGSEVD